MRKQRATFALDERAAADGDRVTVDFVGTIDGVAFPGGSGTDFDLALGEGRMLPEFEAAVRGMQANDEKNFALAFPSGYRAQELAGKAAQFKVKVRKVAQAELPLIDAEFARSLGVADGDLPRMRAEIRANLEREVGARLKARTKDSVMDALLTTARFDVPRALVAQEQQRLADRARADLQARGVLLKDTPLPMEVFAASAERRVRLGLLL